MRNEVPETHEFEARLSEFEFALIVAMNGFTNWVSHCADASGARGLSAVDMLVLHAINLRARDRRLTDICMVLNIEDSHIVAYSLKKLVEYGYAQNRRTGREHLYSPTAEGDALCARYLVMRRRALISALREDRLEPAELEDPATTLRLLARSYGQASRTSTVLSQTRPSPEFGSADQARP
jgi:predicted MarR family transcription regulator